MVTRWWSQVFSIVIQTFLCLGVLGLFSIGLPLLVAGFIGLYAASSATEGNARRSVLR